MSFFPLLVWLQLETTESFKPVTLYLSVLWSRICNTGIQIVIVLHVIQKSTHTLLIYFTYPGRILLQHDIEFRLLRKLSIQQPTFSLTCVTTGGPPATVVWTRDNIEIDYQSNSNFTFSRTVTNFTTSTYNNTLTVTGRYPGQYGMTAWNRNTVVYISNQFATSAILVTGKHLLEKHEYTMLLNTDLVFTCSCCPTHPPHCCARV